MTNLRQGLGRTLLAIGVK